MSSGRADIGLDFAESGCPGLSGSGSSYPEQVPLAVGFDPECRLFRYEGYHPFEQVPHDVFPAVARVETV